MTVGYPTLDLHKPLTFGPWLKPPVVVGGWKAKSPTILQTGVGTHAVLPAVFFDEIRCSHKAELDGWLFRYARRWAKPELGTWSWDFSLTKAFLLNDDPDEIAKAINKFIERGFDAMERRTYDRRESDLRQQPLFAP